MEFLHAVILGIVQGIAEFLPISSSGHLVIADALLQRWTHVGTPDKGVTMEVALHFGTLMSIVVVYWHDLIRLLTDRRLLLLIIIASVPVAVTGLLLKAQVESLFNSPLYAGIALLVTAALLVTGQRLQKCTKSLADLNSATAVLIGLFQAIAIIPGISRSGSTIAAGMIGGLDRENAARFSFLIAVPAIAGATLLQLKDLVDGSATLSGSPAAIAFGTLLAFATGVLALRWLIRLVAADRLHYFAIYCTVVGSLTIAWQLAG